MTSGAWRLAPMDRVLRAEVTTRSKSGMLVKRRMLRFLKMPADHRALSWANRKMILVTSRLIISLFLTDEEQLANLQVWQNLLRACREKLWDGKVEGQRVQVWGWIHFDRMNRSNGRPKLCGLASGLFIFHFGGKLNKTPIAFGNRV